MWIIFLCFQASFEDDARIAFLTLLEYEPNEVREKIAEKTGSKPANAQAHEQGKYILIIIFFSIEKFDIFVDFIKSKFYKKRGATFFYDVTCKLGPLDFTQYRSKSSSF